VSATLVSACGLDANGLDFFPPDAGADAAPPPPDAPPKADAAPHGSMRGGHVPYALAAGATVCSSPSYRVVVSLGSGPANARPIVSPSYKVVGAVAGVSPK
jgi:hypothetical protein